MWFTRYISFLKYNSSTQDCRVTGMAKHALNVIQAHSLHPVRLPELITLLLMYQVEFKSLWSAALWLANYFWHKAESCCYLAVLWWPFRREKMDLVQVIVHRHPYHHHEHFCAVEDEYNHCGGQGFPARPYDSDAVPTAHLYFLHPFLGITHSNHMHHNKWWWDAQTMIHRLLGNTILLI